MWPVIIGIESHYLKPTFMGDKLEIRTQVVHHDRASFTFEQNIFRDGIHIVKAKVRSVMVDKAGRLVRRPDEINRLWENLQP
jgi:YbgC/YbaW family acyl-CoA thioester hydrolase